VCECLCVCVQMTNTPSIIDVRDIKAKPTGIVLTILTPGIGRTPSRKDSGARISSLLLLVRSHICSDYGLGLGVSKNEGLGFGYMVQRSGFWVYVTVYEVD